ncbi:hypothetical protein SAMN05660330_03572 [Desulforhopalus singaporensis]|uniref:Uncharacterized protein n=1 Tax=Desulforhopalus singaporensis TaxID=91360 RepID=A0A1H0UIH1_9BACT|nr:hypothetical protein SAMN05660330_03572 [Desulforhopalus singaporensis]
MLKGPYNFLLPLPGWDVKKAAAGSENDKALNRKVRALSSVISRRLYLDDVCSSRTLGAVYHFKSYPCTFVK